MITADTVSSEEVLIEAPVELVWQVLVDFANYDLWNAFCPSCEAELELGTPVKMQVDLGFGLMEQIETMCRIEPCKVIAWRMDNKPGDPIHAVRCQFLNKLSETSCSYLSVDKFSGEGLKAMMDVMAGAVEAGFNSCALGLKSHCEQLYASGNS